MHFARSRRKAVLAGTVIALIVLFVLFTPSRNPYTNQESYLGYHSSSTRYFTLVAGPLVLATYHEEVVPLPLTLSSYKISIIADMDKDSKVETYQWKSLLREGTLTRAEDGTYSVHWDDDVRDVIVYQNDC